MTNITPVPPPFIFGYWRPWNEDSKFFDSYLDYVKDKSLAKYTSNIVGTYISQASAEQVQAINSVGQKIGMGLNAISDRLADIDSELSFINKNLDMLREQHRVTNLLLQNISELLRVPDSEKERQRSIELGLKFFVNAQKDDDLYAESLEEFLKAEQLMRQDFFVLYRIGLIYLYSTKHINPQKAFDYFNRAAKYVILLTEEEAKELICAQRNEDDLISMYYSTKGEKFGISLLYESGGERKRTDVKYDLDSLDELGRYDFSRGIKLLGHAQPVFAGEVYSKAAFSAYIMGKYSDAVYFAEKAYNCVPKPENIFMLVKYKLRTGQIDEAINFLNESIEKFPKLVLACFADLDIINEKRVTDLLISKNDLLERSFDGIKNAIISMGDKSVFGKYINELRELTKNDYVKKREYSRLLNGELVHEIKWLSMYFNKEIYINLKEEDIRKIINDLNDCLVKEPEVRWQIYSENYNLYEKRLKIGSKYGGGIVYDLSFHEDIVEIGVVTDHDLGIAKWGEKVNCGAWFENGYENTKKIMEKASWEIKKGWFSKERIPVQTAARICSELILNGFDDWYLPSFNELKLMNSNLFKDDPDNYPYGQGFWSSTEYSQEAYIVNCGGMFDDDYKAKCEQGFSKQQIKVYEKKMKDELFYVRAVRRFRIDKRNFLK